MATAVTPSELRNAYVSLQSAIDDFEALNDGIHWEAIYPGLDSPEPEREARQMAAQYVRDAARELQKMLGVLLTDTTSEHGQSKKAAA